ncbi:MAG: DUF1801 domain-containing protein [Rhodoglobus sp.]
MARTQFATLAEFLDAQPTAVRAEVDLLRELVTTADPTLIEIIKWNSPTFTLDGEDRLTVSVDGKNAVRLILHRGTAVAERKGAATSFAGDPGGLLTWHSDIRASMLATAALDRDAATAVIRAWLRFDG